MIANIKPEVKNEEIFVLGALSSSEKAETDGEHKRCKNDSTWGEVHEVIITDKLENFYKPENGPHQVFVSVRLTSVRNVITSEQTFEARFIVEQQWQLGENDMEEVRKVSGRTHRITPSWQPPKLYYSKIQQIKKEVQGPFKFAWLDNMPTFTLQTDVHAIFCEPFELQSFPFDCQDLCMNIEWQASEKIQLIWPTPSAQFIHISTSDFVLTEWKFHPPICEFLKIPFETLNEDLVPEINFKPKLRLRLKMERIWRPYLFEVYLVMALISFCALFSFSFSLEDAGDRVSQATTMLLTTVAFQYVINSMIPKLNYLTLLNKYILTCNIFVAVVVAQVGGVTWLRTHDDVNFSDTDDNYLFLLNFLCWLFYHIYFAFQVVIWTLPMEKAKLTKSTAELKWVEKSMHYDHDIPASRVEVNCLGDLDYEVYRGKVANDRRRQIKDANTALRVSPLEKAHPLCGIFAAKYGPHGIEYFYSYISIEIGVPKLKLRKITGDPNVPAGNISVICSGVPLVGGGEENFVAAKFQVRDDINDINGYSWMDVQLWSDNENLIWYKVPKWGNFKARFDRK